MAKGKKTRKQIERAAQKRAIKALRQKHHEKWAGDRQSKKYVVSGGAGEEVCLKAARGKARQKQRRNGSGLRVGGR